MVTPQKHKKFDDQEEVLKDVPSEIPEKTSKVAEQDSDASSSDDDEAPEEEGMAQARSAVQQRDHERQQAAAREQEALREKRRKQDLRFKQQQEQKREREEKELEARLKAQVSSRGAAESGSIQDDDMVPAELPENFFEELEEQESATITTKPQHVNFNDIDDNYSQEIKQQLQKQKKKTLRQLRKTSMKRGPVKVNLLPPASNSKALAPQQDTTVTNKREKWLKRKALARK